MQNKPTNNPTLSNIKKRGFKALKLLRLRLGPEGMKNLLLYGFLRIRYRKSISGNPVYQIQRSQLKMRLRNEKWNRFGFTPIMVGDWDLNRYRFYEEASRNETNAFGSSGSTGFFPVDDGNFCQIKLICVLEHFKDGVPWENTELFKGYEKRFDTEPFLRRCRNMEELQTYYETRYETLYASIRKKGLLAEEPLPVYIGRKGDYLFGSDGNHRLAMAAALDIPYIYIRVKARHADWQRIREHLARTGALPEEHRHLLDHPDLQDIRKKNKPAR